MNFYNISLINKFIIFFGKRQGKKHSFGLESQGSLLPKKSVHPVFFFKFVTN